MHEAGRGIGPPQWRDVGFGWNGGLVVDWELKTNLEGLFAAGGNSKDWRLFRGICYWEICW